VTPEQARFLALSDERDLWRRAAEVWERMAYWLGYRLGWDRGYRAGYERAHADLAADWHAMAWRVAHGDPRSHAELERARWGPGGRERFGDPRPGERRPWTAGGAR